MKAEVGHDRGLASGAGDLRYEIVVALDSLSCRDANLAASRSSPPKRGIRDSQHRRAC